MPPNFKLPEQARLVCLSVPVGLCRLLSLTPRSVWETWLPHTLPDHARLHGAPSDGCRAVPQATARARCTWWHLLLCAEAQLLGEI